MIVAQVALLVAIPRITSTNFIMGTGFMKCMPITLSGRCVVVASLVIEMLEVLVARMASGGQIVSSLRSI